MCITEMFFTPLQQECQMWQKQLSENLFCIESNKICYADEILEITVFQYNNFKSDSLLATFSRLSVVKNQQPLFPHTTEHTFGKLFPEHLVYTLYKYAGLCWENCI